MFRFLVVRVLSVVPTLLGISFLVFISVRLVPGDPIDIMYAMRPKPSPAQRLAIEKELGLDGPIYRQYLRYVGHAATGDLGISVRTKRPISGHIKTRLPNTTKLALAGLLVAVLIGLPAGILSATFPNSWIDRVSMVVAIAGVSVPAFWFGLMLMLVFSVQLHWLPVAGAQSWKHILMPAITLGFGLSAVLARITRASMMESLHQDYVRTARAKGLREVVVVYRHALRNALIPVVTITGLLIGGLLSGVVIIEAVFGYPGLGLLAVSALTQRDFPMIQGMTLFVAVVYVVVNMLVDVLYAVIDPRITFD